MVQKRYRLRILILAMVMFMFPALVQAQWNKALHFSWWQHDRVIVPDAPSLFPFVLNAGTVEMWFKPDSTLDAGTHAPDYTYLISKNLSGNVEGDMGLTWQRNEGDLQCFIQDGTVTQDVYPGIPVWEPRWYHLAFVWDTNDSMRIFIDGVQSADIEPNSDGETCLPLYGGTQEIVIGSGAVNLLDNRYETFRGAIDEVRISAVARYTSDFSPATQPFEPDAFTIALWHFDEGTGNDAMDATGNGFNGTLGVPDSSYAQPEWIDVVRDPMIIVNEMLADPAEGVPDGDSNGDGVRDAQDDEFVELINISGREIDMTGWKLGDDEKINFQFPDGYMFQPFDIITVFGGGDASSVPGYNSDPMLTRVFVTGDSVGNGLANGGDYFVLQSADGSHDLYFGYGSKLNAGPPTSDVVAGITWEFETQTAANAGNNNSVTRSPDANTSVEDPFVEHLSVSSAPFSPSTTIDGSSALTFSINVSTSGSGTVSFDPAETKYQYGTVVTITAQPADGYVFAKWKNGEEENLSNPYSVTVNGTLDLAVTFLPAFQVAPHIIVNEILADPKADPIIGDANGDGIQSSVEDEFVELVNVSSSPIDLTGYQMGDDEMITFTFPNGYIMQPGQIITIFGGGDLSNVPGYNADPLLTRAFKADSIGVGNGLANGGDFFLLLSPNGDYDLYAGYNSKYNSGPPTSDVVTGIDFEIRIETAAPAANDNSVTRNPDGNITVGDPFVEHLSLGTASFSPGKTIDGNDVIIVSVEEDDGNPFPNSYKLYENYPNPFNPNTTIRFEIPQASHVVLKVYNIQGEEIATLVNNSLNAGSYKAQWNGRNLNGETLSSGIYIYRIITDNFSQSHKMIMLK